MSYLARFGAEVTKLEPVEPSYEPSCGSYFTLQTDMGKSKVLLDIKSEEGRAIFHRMLRGADVLIINAVPRQLASLGLEWETLLSVNPDLIFCRLDAFGGPNLGREGLYVLLLV